MPANSIQEDAFAPPCPSLLSSNPARWLSVFGPGAIVASLTIGTGELIFSSRGGAIFGYSVLWVFLFVSLLKWALVFASARHLVLSGAHPFQRWRQLPGPTGWLPIALLLPAVITIPIWIGFLAGTVGTLFQDMSGVDKHLCGAVALAVVAAFVFLGGYGTLEKVQLFVVGAMLLTVSVSVVLMRPDWGAVAWGLLAPTKLAYPSWLQTAAPGIAARPVWIEVSLYVGIVGGASYDYIAYVAFLREKPWGLSAQVSPASEETLRDIAADKRHAVRVWLRAPLIDCTMSFAAVIAFSAAFVISGALALGPKHLIPSGDNLLNLQAEFVTGLHPWLYPLYVVGATLALMGTLYGTNEVGPAMVHELIRAERPAFAARRAPTIRAAVITWGIAGGYLVLAWSFANHLRGGAGQPPTLVEIVTPAALFTHVFSCALICFLNPWMDRRFLPKPLRMHRLLAMLNVVAGVVFLTVGLKSYWDYGAQRTSNPLLGGALAVGCIAVTIALGWLVALVVNGGKK